LRVLIVCQGVGSLRLNLAHSPVRIFAWLGADMEFDWLRVFPPNGTSLNLPSDS